MIVLSETNISSVNPVYPKTPSNGAIIFLSLSATITSPFLIELLSFNSSWRSFFLIRKDFVLFDTAVPKVSILSWNCLFTTSVTIIPGGGLLLNFFLK